MPSRKSGRPCRRTGLRLKGQDGPPVDLARNGAQVELLGFRLSKQEDRLCYELEDDAWQELKDDLAVAHLSDRPARKARAVTKGWLQGYAPALETDAEVAVCRRLRSTLRDTGLEYELPVELIGKYLRKAQEQWERLRSHRRHFLRGIEREESGRCAPARCISPLSQSNLRLRRPTTRLYRPPCRTPSRRLHFRSGLSQLQTDSARGSRSLPQGGPHLGQTNSDGTLRHHRTMASLDAAHSEEGAIMSVEITLWQASRAGKLKCNWWRPYVARILGCCMCYKAARQFLEPVSSERGGRWVFRNCRKWAVRDSRAAGVQMQGSVFRSLPRGPNRLLTGSTDQRQLPVSRLVGNTTG